MQISVGVLDLGEVSFSCSTHVMKVDMTKLASKVLEGMPSRLGIPMGGNLLQATLADSGFPSSIPIRQGPKREELPLEYSRMIAV